MPARVKGILAPSTTTTFFAALCGREEYMRAALTAVDSIHLKDELLLLFDSIIILKLLFRTMATAYENYVLEWNFNLSAVVVDSTQLV